MPLLDQMKGIITAISGISTPIAMVSLFFIVLFFLYKAIISKVPSETIRGNAALRLLMTMMTYVFIVAIVGLVLAVVAYMLNVYVATATNSENRNRFTQALGLLTAPDSSQRAAAAQTVFAVAQIDNAYLAEACSQLSRQVRWILSESDDSEEALRSLKYLSMLNTATTCMIALNRANLREVDLSDFNLSRSLMHDAVLRGSLLEKTLLESADFTNARLEGAQFISARAANADFVSARISDVSFYDSDLRKAKGLQNRDLTTVLFQNAQLSEVDFRGSKFGAATLKDAVIDGANFSGADLSRDRSLNCAMLEHAVVSTETILPSGLSCPNPTN